MENPAVLAWSSELVLRGEDCVCFNPRNGFVFRFNDTGYLAFLLYEKGNSLQSDSRSLSKLFDQPDCEIARDLAPLVEELIEKGFLIHEQ